MTYRTWPCKVLVAVAIMALKQRLRTLVMDPVECKMNQQSEQLIG